MRFIGVRRCFSTTRRFTFDQLNRLLNRRISNEMDSFKRSHDWKERSLAKVEYLTEFPSVPAFVAQHKSSHRFVGGTRLHLIISAVTLFAFTAF